MIIMKTKKVLKKISMLRHKNEGSGEEEWEKKTHKKEMNNPSFL